MAVSAPIANVVAVIGKAYARDENGSVREVFAGDILREGEVIFTSADGSVELAMLDGDSLTVAGADEVALTSDITDQAPTAAQSAMDDETVASILEALDEGRELSEVLAELDATAAGAGVAGEGHDFVQLARIVEQLTPSIIALTDGFSSDEAIEPNDAIPETTQNAAQIDTFPTINVTANDFTEDAGGLVAGVSVAGTYTASDAEGDAFTVTVNTASTHYTLDAANNRVLLTQAGIDVINAGGTLDAIDLKVTQNDNALLSNTDDDTPVVTPVADIPNLGLTNTPTQATGSGLLLESWSGISLQGSEKLGDGYDPAELPGGIEALTSPDNSNTVLEVNDASVLAGTATHISGLVYLQAGSTYTFSGRGDDSMAVRIGGQNVATGVWKDNDPASPNGALVPGSFTPSESGYYTVDVYHHNQSGPGNYSLNMSVNGGPALPFNSTNADLYQSVTDITEDGQRISPLLGSDGNGFHRPYQVNEGDEGSAIPLSTVSASLADLNSSETLTVSISGVPLGGIISDGTFSVTSTGVNHEINISSWNHASLSYTGSAVNSSEIHQLSVKATATEANGSTQSNTVTVDVKVFDTAPQPSTNVIANNDVVLTNITDGSVIDIPNAALLHNDSVVEGASITAVARGFGGDATGQGPVSYDPAGSITGSSNNSFEYTVSAGGLRDSATVDVQGQSGSTITGGNGAEVLVAGDGADTLQGNGGKDALVAGGGSDNLLGGDDEDLLIGGLGNDTLSGGSDSDEFLWIREDYDNVVGVEKDSITDFTLGVNGDALNVSDLLPVGAADDLTDYLSFSADAVDGHAVLTVDADGSGGQAAALNIDLTNVQYSEIQALGATQMDVLQKLINDGNLNID